MSRLVVALSLAACATPTGYQALGPNGGYSESRTADNAFVVRFEGNANTSPEQADDFALMRAAELTLANGYSFFGVADSAYETSATRYLGPTKTKTETVQVTKLLTRTKTTISRKQTVVTRPVTALVVVCSTAQPDGSDASYSAKTVLDALAQKYGIAAPAVATKQ